MNKIDEHAVFELAQNKTDYRNANEFSHENKKTELRSKIKTVAS